MSSPGGQQPASAASSARPSRSSRSSSGGGGIGACGADHEARKSSGGSQRVCRYCFQGYSETENRKGSCAEAPDPSANYVELLSCVCCARIFAYHCFADDDGDYEHPCAPYAPASTIMAEEVAEEMLDGPSQHGAGCPASEQAWGDEFKSPGSDAGAGATSWRKWTLMSLLALCVPCLCLYFPLRACHSWALKHHLAGGRHEAVTAHPADLARHRRRRASSGPSSSAAKYSVPREEEEEAAEARPAVAEEEEDDDVIFEQPSPTVSESMA